MGNSAAWHIADEVVHDRVNSVPGLTPPLRGIGALIDLAKVVHGALPRLGERRTRIDADGQSLLSDA